MYWNQTQMSDLHTVFAATNQKDNVVFANYYFCWWQKKVGSLTIGKLRPRATVTFLRTCKCNISFDQWV